MKERPIIFSTPMVQAILESRKTQTRRVVKTQPAGYYKCPYGQVGDRLIVRESWRPVYLGYDYCDVEYAATPTIRVERGCIAERDRELAVHYGDKCGWGVKWCTPIHMPRWASRITLEITDVRVEQIQDISPGDILAEGVATDHTRVPVGTVDMHPIEYFDKTTAIVFRELWDSINSGRGFGWDVNPWVWAISFKRVQP